MYQLSIETRKVTHISHILPNPCGAQLVCILTDLLHSNRLSNGTTFSMYSVSQKLENAHEDNIWAVAWWTNEKDGTENIITGGKESL